MLSPFAVKLVRTQQVVFFFTFFVSINYHDMTKYGGGDKSNNDNTSNNGKKKRVIDSKLDCSTSH